MPAHRASFTFHLSDSSSARAAATALALEVADGPEGSTASLAVTGTTIEAELEADSVSGLRAATNSLLRLLDAAMRTL